LYNITHHDNELVHAAEHAKQQDEASHRQAKKLKYHLPTHRKRMLEIQATTM
jgi:hypothetical protein